MENKTVNRKKTARKPDRKIPVPKNCDTLIVLTGLMHTETGHHFAFCTADSNEGFFLDPEDMESPDGGEDLTADCERCKTKSGQAETHWIVNFRTALSEGRVDIEDGDHCLSDLSLINNLLGARWAGPVERPATARKAATS